MLHWRSLESKPLELNLYTTAVRHELCVGSKGFEVCKQASPIGLWIVHLIEAKYFIALPMRSLAWGKTLLCSGCIDFLAINDIRFESMKMHKYICIEVI
jgi:hypothetical protein